MESILIRKAAKLLVNQPSTYKEDYPRVPLYYMREIEKYKELGRQSAILMGEAKEHIADFKKLVRLLEKEKLTVDDKCKIYKLKTKLGVTT